MPQRHSKNNNDLAFFTYEEKRKLGYGTQRERLGKESVKPFDACCLCLKRLLLPLCCPEGHLFCKECIYQCLLAQKKSIHRKLASFQAQQQHHQDQQQEKRLQQTARDLESFDRQNHGALPTQSSPAPAPAPGDRHHFHGANSVKTTSYEEEALRTMKAFWLPSATPDAPLKLAAPSTHTTCPEGNEKLKLKSLFPVYFTEDKSDAKNKSFICPSCKVTLTNTVSLVAITTCGHVFCKKCADQFVKVDKVCVVCSKGCKDKNLVLLEKGGTGFSAHGDKLEAVDFKHLGSGSGLGLVKPAPKGI